MLRIPSHNAVLTVTGHWHFFFNFQIKKCTGWCRGFLPLPLSYLSFFFFFFFFFFCSCIFLSIKPPTHCYPWCTFNVLQLPFFITKTYLFKYTENFTAKNDNFQIKNSNIFTYFCQNIDCGYSLEPPRWGGSNEYPQSTFLSRNKKNNVYPCKPQFYYIKVGFKGVKII